MLYKKGFTLIEVMIVVAIAALLLYFALPNFQSQIMRSRRSTATATLQNIHLAQVKYRGNNLMYGDLTQVWNAQSTTEGGYYNLAISDVSATGFTVTATPTNGQESDSQNGVSCNPLQLRVNAATVVRTPDACWVK